MTLRLHIPYTLSGRGVTLLITFNDFFTKSINTHPSKFSCAFSKDLKQLFHCVSEANKIFRGKGLTLDLFVF